MYYALGSRFYSKLRVQGDIGYLHSEAWLAEARLVAAKRVPDIDHLFGPRDGRKCVHLYRARGTGEPLPMGSRSTSLAHVSNQIRTHVRRDPQSTLIIFIALQAICRRRSACVQLLLDSSLFCTCGSGSTRLSCRLGRRRSAGGGNRRPCTLAHLWGPLPFGFPSCVKGSSRGAKKRATYWKYEGQFSRTRGGSRAAGELVWDVLSSAAFPRFVTCTFVWRHRRAHGYVCFLHSTHQFAVRKCTYESTGNQYCSSPILLATRILPGEL